MRTKEQNKKTKQKLYMYKFFFWLVALFTRIISLSLPALNSCTIPISLIPAVIALPLGAFPRDRDEFMDTLSEEGEWCEEREKNETSKTQQKRKNEMSQQIK